MGGRDPNSLKFEGCSLEDTLLRDIVNIYLIFQWVIREEPATVLLVVLSAISESGLLGRAAPGVLLCSLLAQIRVGKIALITAGVLDQALRDGTSKCVA
jgi:hypothetical protein